MWDSQFMMYHRCVSLEIQYLIRETYTETSSHSFLLFAYSNIFCLGHSFTSACKAVDLRFSGRDEHEMGKAKQSKTRQYEDRQPNDQLRQRQLCYVQYQQAIQIHSLWPYLMTKPKYNVFFLLHIGGLWIFIIMNLWIINF